MTLEPILAAAFALATSGSGWVTTSRKLLHWADVPASARPALFMTLVGLTAEPLDAVTKWTLDLRLYVYVTHTEPSGPQPLLAARLDALIAAFVPPPGLDGNTLGGLVSSCEISGAIETDEGTLGTDAVAIVPVRIVVG